MSNKIVLKTIKNFDANKLTIDFSSIDAKKPISSLPITYDNKKLFIMTPKCVTPFGFSDYQDNKKFAITCNLDDNKDSGFIDLINAIEDTIYSKLFENLDKLGLKTPKTKLKNIDDLRDCKDCDYLRLLKTHETYGSSITTKVFTATTVLNERDSWKIDKPSIVIFDNHNHLINDFTDKNTAKSSDEIRSIIGKRSTISLIFTIDSIIKSKVGLSFKTNAKQCIVLSSGSSDLTKSMFDEEPNDSDSEYTDSEIEIESDRE